MKTIARQDTSQLPTVLFISSYPPRECGVATYSLDLKEALERKFSHSFAFEICALESAMEQHSYGREVTYTLNVDQPGELASTARQINADDAIGLVLIQHEFGFFHQEEAAFLQFLEAITKPIVIVYHTVLPHPNPILQQNVQHISAKAQALIVMTQSSAEILIRDYAVPTEKITIIAHGTHLLCHPEKEALKEKYQLSGRSVVCTFGLLSPGKSIETTLDALPALVAEIPDIMFLVIGITHPTLVKQEGQRYRQMLEKKVVELNLQAQVRFINSFLPVPALLEYLQLTDIYLFTSKDPNQAVSGTFSYAIACGCPVISTPIPHAREVVKDDAGIIFDFENSSQLSQSIMALMRDGSLRERIGSNGLHRMASTAWENSSIAHARLFAKYTGHHASLRYDMPSINLDHIKKMTTSVGIIQFSKLDHPDIGSGYTLDDNARALIVLCQHYELTREQSDLDGIETYLEFINFCQQPDGRFLNYVDVDGEFTNQNKGTNLEDSNGRAIWGLGYLISMTSVLPATLTTLATSVLQKALVNVQEIHSTRAMGFAIKGLYYFNKVDSTDQVVALVDELATRLLRMYRHEQVNDWKWFESYLTYANSILPEAMLLAWRATGNVMYKKVAKESFDFLLSKLFTEARIRVISNKSWLYRDRVQESDIPGGEQPIDVAYTVLALQQFYSVFGENDYRKKGRDAFNWFLGNNHLHQIIYNPCTGGCYDGLEENYVNLNQGAESTVSYLLARLTMTPAGWRTTAAANNGRKADRDLLALPGR